MDIPLTPALMALQAQTPRSDYSDASITDASREIAELLDGFTFNEQETRILQILADLGPEDFIRCLKLLASYTVVEGWRNPQTVSYLQRLYEDMDGQEFHALCEMFKAKLLAVKAGSLERMAEVADKALNGETTPEIPVRRDFGSSKLTSPGTWGRRSFPCHTEFALDGSIRGDWWESVGYLTAIGEGQPLRMQLTDLVVVSHIHAPVRNDIATLLDIKSLSDAQHREFFFTNLNIVGIVFGVGMFAAARGLAKQAIVGLFQVALPTAGQFITDNEEKILELEYGREFLIVWEVVSVAMMAYGLYQLFSPAGKSLLGKLTSGKDSLLTKNPGDEVAQDAAKMVEKVSEALADVEAKVVEPGIEPSSKTPGGRPAPAPDPPALDPSLPVPVIPGGTCVASAKTELGIILAVKRHPNPENVQVFQARSGSGAFFLFERPPNTQLTPPQGLEALPRYNLIIDVFDDLGSAKKKLFDAVGSQQAKIEVGIYQKTLGGRVCYLVINGAEDSVTAPHYDGSWKAVGHYHPGAAQNVARHHPAPQDFVTRGFSGRRVEIIFSHDAAGAPIEIEFGSDMSVPDTPYFVKALDGKERWFEDMYPDSIQDALDQIDKNRTLTVAQKLNEKVKVLKTIDPAKYYAGWWASLFP